MILGTAGFTAALSVDRLERHGLRPADGPVLVTGASGGVGSTAVDLLAARGYEVWALTGKAAERDWLRSLGATGLLDRTDAPADGPPLGKERWAGVVDAVGAATLPYGLSTLRRGGAVALSGNVGGATLATTVYPFILRGVALLGIDSAWLAIDERRQLWARMADPLDLRPPHLGSRVAEHGLEELGPVFDALVTGAGVGRHLVRPAGD
jgi:putative YhdH/YhfP family quinone oxidoreductase